MSRAHFRDNVLDNNGNTITGASVEVQDPDSGDPISQTMYAAASGATTVANPLTSDNNGLVEFYLAEPQRVQLAVSKSGYPSGTSVVDVMNVDALIGLPYNVKAYDAKGDGVTDDTTALTNAAAAATIDNAELYFPAGTYSITTDLTFDASTGVHFAKGAMVTIASTKTLTINGPFMAGLYQCFTGSGVVRFGQGAVSAFYPEWWGADNTGTVDSYAAFAAMGACVTAYAHGKIVLSGAYDLNTTWRMTGIDGLIIEGVGGDLSGTVAKCRLDFNGVASGSGGLLLDDVRSLRLRNFYVYHRIGVDGENVYGAGGGAAVEVHTCSGISIENLYIEDMSGTTGYGLKLGRDTSDNCVIVGSIKDCFVSSYGYAYYNGSANTSLTFSGCYALHGLYQYYVGVATYCAYSGCAADSGTWGYYLNGSNAITFTSCGAETNAKGMFNIRGGSINITLISCRGHDNNTDADATIASYCDIGGTGTNYNIVIINPYDSSPDAASLAAIYGRANTLNTTVIGYETSVALTKLIDGDATWKRWYLDIIGSGQNNAVGFMTTKYYYDLQGTTGAFRTMTAEATGTATAAATFNIDLNVPSGARILGVQLRVDTALSHTWDAAYNTGSTQAICTNQAAAKNTKVTAMYNANGATDITSGITDITITRNGGSNFDAGGVVRAIVYYETFNAMANAS